VTKLRGAWCLVLFGLFAAARLPGQDDDMGIAVGTMAPAVTVQDLTGRPVDLARYVGKKPVLIEFWATWCPICKALLPKLEAAERRYGDKVEFLVVAVAVNETQNSVRRHLAQQPMPFTFLWDADGAAVRAFQAPGTSYIVVLDPGGKVVYTGLGEDQDVEGAVKKGLQGR
jgi:thiol-disulfide isomerase/thioredoxin